jgi:hypothetical protein
MLRPHPLVRRCAIAGGVRVYDSASYRAKKSGTIEIEGRWTGVQWIAIGLLVLLPFVARSPLGLGLLSLAAAYIFVFPARRRVIFDVSRRALRIEHAGLFAESGSRSIPLDRVRGIVFQPAGRRGGRDRFALYARTAEGRVYLCTHAGERDTAELDQRLCTLLEE